MSGFFLPWMAIVLTGAVAMLWWVEHRVRSWPQPNWTTPGSRKDALMIIIVPIVFYGMAFASNLALVLRIGDDGVYGTPSIWFLAPGLAAWVAGLSMTVVAYLAARKAPADALRFKVPAIRIEDVARFQLTATALLAGQTFVQHGIAAQVLGLPVLLIHLVRVALIVASLTLYVVLVLEVTSGSSL